MQIRQESIQILRNDVEREEYRRQKKQAQTTKKKDIRNIFPHPCPMRSASYGYKRQHTTGHK